MSTERLAQAKINCWIQTWTCTSVTFISPCTFHVDCVLMYFHVVCTVLASAFGNRISQYPLHQNDECPVNKTWCIKAFLHSWCLLYLHVRSFAVYPCVHTVLASGFENRKSQERFHQTVESSTQALTVSLNVEMFHSVFFRWFHSLVFPKQCWTMWSSAIKKSQTGRQLW